MNKSLAALALMTLMQQQENNQSDKLPEEPKLPPPPPWVNAKYNIPKSQRKGKTYEQILEIKKQIYLKQQQASSGDNNE